MPTTTTTLATMRWPPHTRTYYRRWAAWPHTTYALLHLALSTSKRAHRITAMKCVTEKRAGENQNPYMVRKNTQTRMSEASSHGFFIHFFSFFLLTDLSSRSIAAVVAHTRYHVCWLLVCVHKIVFATSAEHTYFSLLSFLFSIAVLNAVHCSFLFSVYCCVCVLFAVF